MGYLTVVTGEITISPPLTWAEIQDSPHLGKHRNFRAAVLRVGVVQEETAEGTLIRRTASVIEPAWQDPYKARDIEDHLQELVIFHGDGRDFNGHLEGRGVDAADMWRLYVDSENRVRTVTARIVWPEGPWSS